jgi:hypothetical protein
MNKERGTMFRGDMVRAILNDTKHQTRRTTGNYFPGLRLWVKETWTRDEVDVLYYRADTLAPSLIEDYDPTEWKWKSSMFMPQKFSRITLLVKNVYLERLMEITVEDAIDEGYPKDHPADPIDWYRALWESINGPGSWLINPIVHVIKFKKIKPIKAPVSR